MPENNTCVCCGRIIPEGKQICLQCGSYDTMQVFKPTKQDEEKAKRIAKIMESNVAQFLWQHICIRKQSCPAHDCCECVMDWLNKRAE